MTANMTADQSITTTFMDMGSVILDSSLSIFADVRSVFLKRITGLHTLKPN